MYLATNLLNHPLHDLNFRFHYGPHFRLGSAIAILVGFSVFNLVSSLYLLPGLPRL